MPKKESKRNTKSKYDGLFSPGHKFGDWTLLKSETTKIGTAGGGYGESAYEVKCVCGKIRNVKCSRLISGESTSCRCWFYGRGSANPNWRGTQDIPGRYVYRVESSAEKRGIPYNLTPQLIQNQFTVQNSTCALTGTPLYFGDSSTEINTNASLDRIDSVQGYVSGNIQWVRKDVNLAKGTTSQEDFIELCIKVVEHQGHTVIRKNVTQSQNLLIEAMKKAADDFKKDNIMSWNVNEPVDVILGDGQVRRCKVVRLVSSYPIYEVIDTDDQITKYQVGEVAMRKVL